MDFLPLAAEYTPAARSPQWQRPDFKSFLFGSSSGILLDAPFLMSTSRVRILNCNKNTNQISGDPVRHKGCNSLAFAFQQRAIGDALHELHLDFGLLVGDAFGGFRRHDQRLWAIGEIKRALELQRLDAA